MLNIIIIIICIVVFVYYINHNNIKKNGIKVLGGKPLFKKIETFLDYSAVDKREYPEFKRDTCGLKKDNLHISFFQRDKPEENSWLFGYPNYRNYIGGSNATK